MISEGERDFILKTVGIIDHNLNTLEKKVEVLEEELSLKFTNSFVEIDAIKFDIEKIKEKLSGRNNITDHSGV